VRRIDIIFLKNESPYCGKAELLAERINAKITDSEKKDIFKLKLEGKEIEYKRIEIYKAVMEYKIETIDEFIKWKNSKEGDVIIDEEYRGNGLSKKLIEIITGMEELKGMFGILAIRDMHKLYEKYGFVVAH
jgi:GNAT superfamily N-acetyltransferase